MYLFTPLGSEVFSDSNLSVHDFSHWNYEENGMIHLNTPWEFYPGKFCNPNDFSINSKAEDYDSCTKEDRIEILSERWNRIAFQNEKLSSLGFGTYRLNLIVPVRKGLGIKLSEISTSYRFFINSAEIFELGKVGRNFNTSYPNVRLKYIPLDVPEDGRIELIIHVSNFYEYRGGGILANPIIGPIDELHQEDEKKIRIHERLAIAIIVNIFFNLILFYRLKDISFLFLGLFSIEGVLFNTAFESTIWYSVFPESNWHIRIKIEMILGYLTVGTFLQYLNSVIQIKKYKKIILFNVGINYILGLFCFFAPTEITTSTFDLSNLFLIPALVIISLLIYHGYMQNQENAKKLSIGILALIIITFNDILHFYKIWDTGIYLIYGIFFFLLFQSNLLIDSFVRSYFSSKRLSEELSILNKNLESKVLLRTEELQKEKEKAENANQMKDKFITLLVHDVQSPISGGLNLIKSFQSKEENLNDPVKVKEVFNSGLSILNYILKVTREILDFNRFRTGDVRQDYEIVLISDVIHEIIRDLLQLYREKNLRLKIHISEDVTIVTDRTLFHECVLNLLVNAMKYSPPNSDIEIDGDEFGLSIKNFLGNQSENKEILILRELFPYNKRHSSGLGLKLTEEILGILEGRLEILIQNSEVFHVQMIFPISEFIICCLGEKSNLPYHLLDKTKRILFFDDFRHFLEISQRILPEMIYLDRTHPNFQRVREILNKGSSWKDVPRIEFEGT